MLKSTHGRKRVEVVLTTNARKARKRALSVIMVRGSSESEETNIGGKRKALDDSTKPLVSEDEQDPSIHKRKARFQQSSCPMKRVPPSLDTNTAQPSTLKAVKPLFQARSVKKKRLQIISPPICESFDEEGSEAHPPEDRGSRSTPVPVQDAKPDTQLDMQSSRVPIEHPLPTKELWVEQCKSLIICSSCSTN